MTMVDEGKSTADTAARARLTLELSGRLNAEVGRIAKERGIAKADVLRLALEFLSMADAAKAEGMHVGGWKGNTPETRREREFYGI